MKKQLNSAIRTLRAGLLTFAFLFCMQTLFAQAWTGNLSTDWNTPGNWDGGAVPLATDDVTIPDVANDPTIMAGTMAVAKSVTVQSNAVLTIVAMGSLTMNGSTAQGILNQGTVQNTGTIHIGATTSPGNHGIKNEGTFNNNTGGVISIDRSTDSGILNEAGFGGIFTNQGTITIGAIASVGFAGLDNNSIFNNNPGGQINIDRSTNIGLENSSNSIFTNIGTINIGALANIGFRGIFNESIFSNNTGGAIIIDQFRSFGLFNDSGTFNNASTLTIGLTPNDGFSGITNQQGIFNNNTGGAIQINHLSSIGTGLFNHSGTFTNAASISIGANATVGLDGLLNFAIFNNNVGGQINIDRSTNIGLENAEFGTFNNQAAITIGAVASVGSTAIDNRSIFDNSLCDARINIVSNSVITNSGTFTNAGGITENATANSSITDNTGVVQNLNGGTFTTAGNPPITTPGPIDPCCALPMFTACPTPITSNTQGNQCLAAVTYSVTASGNPTFSYTFTGATSGSGNGTGSGADFNKGISTVTITATNTCGAPTCVFTITVNDATKPSITCPGNTIVAANASCSGVVGAYSPASLSDNCTANPSVTQSPASGTALSGHNDSKTVTLTADDGNGNTQACTFTATLKDQTKPSITCPGNAIVVASATCSGVLGAYSPTAVSDNCTANPAVTQSPASSTALSGHNDVKTVTLTADDGNGNTQACSFTVTLKDQTKPTITCPGNAIVVASASCSGVVGAYTPASLSDNCSANPAVTQSPVASTVLNGHNDSKTLTLTADDGNGNTQACTFTVTLKDQTKPSITCPGNAIVAANASCSGVVGAYTPASLSDNCTANPAVTQSPVASTAFSALNDVKTVTLTADDGNGNTQACSFTVTLKDQTKPTITCPGNAIVAASASCGGVVGAYTPATLSDNCAANPAVTQSPVASTVLNGHNDSKTLTLTADDGNGNTQACSFTVTLKDLTPPTLTCKPATANLNAAGSASITTASVYLSGSDNCGVVNLVSVTPNTFNCSNVGANTVTLNGNDGNGNNGTCTATVTVVDPIFPTMFCKNASLTLDANGNATLTVAQVNNGSYDNCSLTLGISQIVFTCANIGANNVTLFGRDQSNNRSECTAVVTVTDPIAPSAKCKNVTANLNGNGLVNLDPLTLNNGSADNCSFSLSVNPGVLNCSNIGPNTVTLKATDAGGNTATCTAIVTVKDASGPTARCKNPTIYLNDEGHVTLSAAQVDNGSTDNCGMGSMSIDKTAFDCSNISGTQSVTLSMTDLNGNSASCTSNVTVKDAIAPSALCEDVTVALGANGQVTVYGADLASNSFDNCSVWSYSPIAKMYTTANLGSNNLTITVKDWSGNAATCVSVVTVVPFGSNFQQGGSGKAGNNGTFDFTVYPNPSAGDVTMAFELPAEQAFSFRIFDLAGRMVYSHEALGVEGENAMPLPVDGFVPGVYLIDFCSDKLIAQKRLVLQR